MNSRATPPAAPPAVRSAAQIGIPRWLHVVSLSAIGLLLVLVVVLILGFVTAGPEENLAFALVIIAGIVAIPLLVALGFWVAGFSLRRRSPGAALNLVTISAVVGGLGVLVVAWFLVGGL